MSFCPNNDIHSVYLDNELPEAYKAEYEAHLKLCPSCHKKLEQLKAVRSLLTADSKSITPDSHYLDESFNRLQIKMAYSKNTAKESRKEFKSYPVFVAAAAAAVFALVLPVSLNSVKTSSISSNEMVASVVPMNTAPVSKTTTANNVSFNSGRTIPVSGNINEVDLSPRSPRDKNSPLVTNAKNVEVLRPDFQDESISIRITVPGMGETPVVTEISLPMEVISGRF